MVQNQRFSSNNRDQNVYLAFLPRQRQGTILVMLEYYARSRTRRKRKTNKIIHTRSREIR